ncbi:acyl-CoA thioesterase [Roseomonas frigidaquae]|uniref:Acyl-CoA thioesterase n=1 Tax=Falsiroseomonas frigidaquae TaxID=487318 RepID=A0ABX1F7V7_9PROT|nr:acyl-CoA thioesterase [Falsiroseomonas frigidaquae]NKE48468.1 acyl-CoA thioesterase [Falsiroseomonas frigidaquae]
MISSPPGLIARRPLTIEWGDCDAAGIVFYPRYFAYFDACTAGLFQQALGMKQIAWAAAHGVIGIPMVDTRSKFSIPCVFGDEVVVETQVTAFRRSSFDVTHRLLREDGSLAVEGFETRVWAGRHPTDPGRIRGVPIPPEVIAAFG